MSALTFSSFSAVASTSLRMDGDVWDRWDRQEPPAPRLMLDDVELELKPESVTGDG